MRIKSEGEMFERSSANASRKGGLNVLPDKSGLKGPKTHQALCLRISKIVYQALVDDERGRP